MLDLVPELYNVCSSRPSVLLLHDYFLFL